MHFSQFGNAPMNLNPALAGVFGGDLRFAANFRDQWRSVPVPYTTLGASVENKFYHQRGKYHKYFTGGLVLNYDRQGSLNLTSLNISIPISYTAPLTENRLHYLTLGVMPSFGQRSFGTDKLTTDSQWNELFFDPFASTKEDLLFANTSIKYFDLSAGVNYRAQAKEKRSRIDVGAAIFHLNQPDHDFWSGGDNVRLSSRVSVYGLGYLQLTHRLDLVFQGLYQKQGGYEKLIYGGGARFHLNPKRYNELAVQVGFNYRSRYRDAWIPYAEVHWRTWVLGVSWDANRSNFRAATQGRGGPEVSLIYRLYRVKPMAFKSCPII
ncbi:MAG: PorP/SprF family type IX secretion system membrane protein [Lewinellaceae bacterium]|nr:PorP/SprF family type IX secretion system membrane protein [Lewinellaceae bacterium]